jgi:hypothetical protein
VLPVGLLDRGQVVEVPLDARRELLRLGTQQLQLALALGALAPPARLVSKASGQPRPFSSDHSRNRAREEGDHQPAHVPDSSYGLNPGPARADIGGMTTQLLVPYMVLWAALMRALLVRAQIAPPLCGRCGLKLERSSLGETICRCH